MLHAIHLRDDEEWREEKQFTDFLFSHSSGCLIKKKQIIQAFSPLSLFTISP